jgi:2-isopropylmalate synthase
MGVATPSEFVTLLETVTNRVPNIEQATLAVHCHNDQGHAVENSLKSLAVGTRQIECSVNGLGVRAGNADLKEIAAAIAQHPSFYTSIESSWLPVLSQQVADITARS